MSAKEDLEARIYEARILVVDDEISSLELMELLLNKRGYKNVFVASDSTSVEKMYELAPCDLVILDMNMPNMDGIAVMRRVKEKLREGDYLPVMVVTARHDIENRILALKEGARDYIAKPFNAEEFLQRVYNHLEVRMLFRNRNQGAG